MLYNEMYIGGVLVHGERSHKYIDKIKTAAGNWRYIYRSPKKHFRSLQGFGEGEDKNDLIEGANRQTARNKGRAEKFTNWTGTHEIFSGKDATNVKLTNDNDYRGNVKEEMRFQTDRHNVNYDKYNSNLIEKAKNKVDKLIRKHKKKK